MKRTGIIALAMLLLAVSCNKGAPVGDSQLVVEGWIESGGHPVVLLSESIPIVVEKQMHSSDLVASLAKWAKVTVDDGQRAVTLTGVADNRYFPPYVFTSSKLTGEVGKTYNLHVEYKDYVADASTTIPQPVPLDTVFVASVTDSLCNVTCGFTDPVEKGNYYKFFTRTEGKDSHYHPSALAQMDDSRMDGYTEVFLYSTQRLMDLIDLPNIKEGDEMWVKLCTMDETGYRFWTAFETMLASNTFNMYFGADMGANIRGGVGYWIGYGVDGEKHLLLTDPAKE